MDKPGIRIIYEDNHLLVVEKPQNVPTQEDESKDLDMLTILKQYIKEKYSKPGKVFLGLIHRLDRPVGGIMVFGKTSKSASRLSEQVRNKDFKKVYMAVVNGILAKKEGALRHYLIKDTSRNVVRAVSSCAEGAKEAVLEYSCLGIEGKYSLVKIILHTGRSHQIRVQFSEIGHPLYGDQKYGREINLEGQQIALWSNTIAFRHPTTNESLIFISNPPQVYPWDLFAKYIRAD